MVDMILPILATAVVLVAEPLLAVYRDLQGAMNADVSACAHILGYCRLQGLPSAVA